MLSETHRPFMIVLTKADKVKDKQISTNLNKTADYIK